MITVETQFRIGQKVRLNSGSPDLEVVEVDESNRVTCEWHNGVTVERLILRAECFRLPM